MRLGPFLVVLWVLYIAMGVADYTLSPNLTGYGSGMNYFFTILIQPWQWQSNVFLIILASAVGAGLLISVGSAFISRSDIVTLASLATVFLSMGAIPLVVLYSFITRNVGMFACSVGQTCFESNLAGALIAGVLSLMYAMTVLEWWMWRPATQ